VPFLDWANHLVDLSVKARIESRGYRSDTWQEIDRIRASVEQLPEGFLIPMRAFRAGECPNESRVYFSFLASGASDPRSGSPVGFFLGRRSMMSRGRAGGELDRQVEAANRDANDSLSRNPILIEIPTASSRVVRGFYNRRLTLLTRIMRQQGLAVADLKMRVKKSLRKKSGIEIGEGEPDGFWLTTSLEAQRGGIFECKLSLPPTDMRARILAAYALLAEYQFKQDFDFGCYLYLEGAGRRPRVLTIPITEVSRQDALRNLERAIALIARARLEGRRLRKGAPWASFLLKPEAPLRIAACNHCFFLERCKPQKASN